MRWIWIFVTFLPLLSLAAEQQHRKSEYAEVNKILNLAKNKTRSPFLKTKIQLNLEDESLSFSDLKFWISRDGQIINQIVIQSDGVIDLPVYNKLDAASTWFNINQPKGAVSLTLNFDLSIGTKKDVSYYDLFIVLDDINEFMGDMAGMASWLMPDMDTLKILFDKPATIQIFSKNKTYNFKTNKKHEISIDVRRKLYKENPRVVFSSSPVALIPED